MQFSMTGRANQYALDQFILEILPGHNAVATTTQIEFLVFVNQMMEIQGWRESLATYLASIHSFQPSDNLGIVPDPTLMVVGWLGVVLASPVFPREHPLATLTPGFVSHLCTRFLVATKLVYGLFYLASSTYFCFHADIIYGLHKSVKLR